MPRYMVKVNGREFDIRLEYRAGPMTVSVNGADRQVVVNKLGDARSLMLVDNQSLEVDVRGNATGERVVFMKGMEIPVSVENYNLAQMRKAAGISGASAIEQFFKAPMPGLIVDVMVEPGQIVKSGQSLIIIEAMKMENVLKARADGTIRSINVQNGKTVEKGDKLIEFDL